MTQLRLAPSGPIIVGDANGDVLIWNATTREWEPGPQSGGGGTVEPIQQVRYLDANSAAAEPNGSIAAPWLDPADFFSFILGPGGWALMLPAFDAGDFSIPDLAGVPVALIGVTSAASSIGSIPVVAQGGSEPFDPLVLTFRDLTTGTVSFGGGPVRLEFERCVVGSAEASGTVSGAVRFVNCQVSQANFPDADTDWVNCVIGRSSGAPTTIAILNGKFVGCEFLNAVTLLLFGSATMYDCEFGDGLVIQCSTTNRIEMDPVSFGRILVAAPTYPDTAPQLVQVPRVLYQQQIDLINGAILPAASIQDFNLGQVPTEPPALPGGFAQVQFLGSPNATVACVGATIDGSGNVIVSVLNTSDTLTAEVVNDQPFVVFYQPAEIFTF